METNSTGSYLLDSDKLQLLDLQTLRTMTFARFGETLIKTVPTDSIQEAVSEALNDPASFDEWVRCVAAELLLAQAVQSEMKVEDLGDFARIKPFGEESPALEEIWDLQVATSLIPINASPYPVLAQIWLVKDPKNRIKSDHRKGWTTASSWLEEHASEFKFFTVISEESRFNIEGPSWQLAAALALKCISEKDPKVILSLATEWLITGKAKGNTVHWIDLGNKTELQKIPGFSRKWMIPHENWQKLSPTFHSENEGRIALVTDLTTAWNHLSGTGTLEEPDRANWPEPEKVEAFHGLVSLVIRPMIASILLTQPRLVCLWKSGQSEKYAIIVKSVLEELKLKGYLPANLTVDIKEISSNSLKNAEQALRDYKLNLPYHKIILFNITGGNMIMKWAVSNMASQNPQIWLIYKDVDHPSLQYMRLRAKGNQFTTSPIKPDKFFCSLKKWDLFFQAADPKDTPEKILNEIFNSEH